jgi:hypothetical protein
MDAIGQCLAVVPVPGLQVAFNLFKALYNGVENSKASKERLKVLALCVAELLIAVNRQFVERKLLAERTSAAIGGLIK